MMFAVEPYNNHSERQVVHWPVTGEVCGMRKPKCIVCGVELEGYSPRAANVKCGQCRKTPAIRQKSKSPVKGFARILLLENIPYEYEPRVFKLVSGHYTPDFRLLKEFRGIPQRWVELKGWRHKDGRLPDGTAGKAREFRESTGEEVFVLTGHDPLWTSLKQEYAPCIPLWETPGRNLRTHPELFSRDG